ncbi:MAG: GNAT family N-acetyltransferase [Candidatus Thiodiazotropha sp.]
MHIKHIVDVSSLPLSHEAWNKLVSQNETNTLFQTYEWFSSWHKTFAENSELWLLIVYERETPIGFAPLVISKENNKGKTIQLIGYNNAENLDFVTQTKKQAAVNLIFDYLLDNTHSWDRIILNNIPRASTTSGLIEEACKRHKLQYLKNKSISCPYLQIEGHQGEVNKLLNKYSNKRPYNYFRRQGHLEFRLLTEKDMDKHLPAFFAQHIRRWSDTTSPSLFNNPLNQTFYKNLTAQLLATNWLHFSVLELDDTAISYHYGFDYNDKYYWYKPAFNTDYSNHSPGTLLIRFLIQSALEHKRRELDFTIGDEAFKRRFTNKERNNVNLQIFRKNRTFWLHNALQRTARLKRRFFD